MASMAISMISYENHMYSRNHWDKVYTTRSPESVSWFQEHPSISLKLIARTGVPPEAHIIDVGGGASTLVDDLLSRGFHHISVLDLSAAALQAARSRVGDRAASVDWIVGDITSVQLPENHFDVWHDRAVFHFLVDELARSAYKATLERALKPHGHLVLSTFAEDGPTQCSGLPVRRYSVAEMARELGAKFQLVYAEKEQHHTPAGAVQNFNYCWFRRSG